MITRTAIDFYPVPIPDFIFSNIYYVINDYEIWQLTSTRITI